MLLNSSETDFLRALDAMAYARVSASEYWMVQRLEKAGLVRTYTGQACAVMCHLTDAGKSLARYEAATSRALAEAGDQR